VKPPGPTESEKPGLPGLGTWRGVYWVVIASLAAWIGFLAVLPRLFS